MLKPLEFGLVRALRRWDLVAITLNGTIGAGIFGLPSQIYRYTGSYSLIVFAVCSLFVVSIVLCFAELGGRFNQSGGPYLYARQAFGPRVSFTVGWMLWID